jgi:hypothetical protein
MMISTYIDLLIQFQISADDNCTHIHNFWELCMPVHLARYFSLFCVQGGVKILIFVSTCTCVMVGSSAICATKLCEQCIVCRCYIQSFPYLFVQSGPVHTCLDHTWFSLVLFTHVLTIHGV